MPSVHFDECDRKSVSHAYEYKSDVHTTGADS